MLTFDACKPLPNQHLCPSPVTLSAFHIRVIAAVGLPNPALLVFLAQTNERTLTTACANPANETPPPRLCDELPEIFQNPPQEPK